MKTKKEHIQSLWDRKSPTSIVLTLYELIDNTDANQSAKDKTYAVLKGIVTYLDRGDPLYEHHRRYLKDVWEVAWNTQIDDSVKNDIKKWLLDEE